MTGETGGVTRSQSGRLVLSEPGHFHGFHHDGLERRENTAVLSTNSLFKLKTGVGRGLRRKRKGNVYNQLEITITCCYAVFYSTMVVVVVPIGKPVLLLTSAAITTALFSC